MLYTKLQTQCVGSCKYNDTPKNATYNKDELSSHDCNPVWWSVANVKVHRLLLQKYNGRKWTIKVIQHHTLHQWQMIATTDCSNITLQTIIVIHSKRSSSHQACRHPIHRVARLGSEHVRCSSAWARSCISSPWTTKKKGTNRKAHGGGEKKVSMDWQNHMHIY